MIRFSDMTSYVHGFHFQTDRRWIAGRSLRHTDVSFEFNGEHYGCRFEGTLSPRELDEEEDRFLERRHARRPRPRSVT
jgi:hypothetical protein